ncbi:MAG: hypothetical protein Q9181_006870 [Wetmoreana brouardii]
MDTPPYEPHFDGEEVDYSVSDTESQPCSQVTSSTTPKNVILQTKYSETHPNNLTYPVNPLFSLSRWEIPNSGDQLEPILRLASLILESPASQRHIHSLISYTDHQKIPESEGKNKRSHARNPNSNCHSPKSTASAEAISHDVKKASRRLARILTFHWTDIEPSGGDPQSGNNEPLSRNSHHIRWSNSHIGAHTHTHIDIYMPYDSFGWILNLERSRSSGDPRPSALTEEASLRFTLAKTLCHAVIQAFEKLPDNPCGMDCSHYYLSQRGSQVGAAWEKEVFGVARFGFQPFRRWEYLGGPEWMALEDGREVLVVGDMVYWIVVNDSTVDFVAGIQRQEFWDRERKTEGMLRVPGIGLEEARVMYGVEYR